MPATPEYNIPKGIEGTIGNTPLVELTRINPQRNVRIFAKLEGCNPGGSIKDRTALFMIRSAERAGLLTKDQVIIEPTSGNTGIALAMIGASLGYHVKLIMPACASIERQRTIEAFGAEVELTPPEQGTDGAILRAHVMAAERPDYYFIPDQFRNPANVMAHYETTGPEIFSQLGVHIDAFVAGMGTTGTLMGIGRYLKERIPDVRIIGVEPEKGHKVQGLKNMEESIVPQIFCPEVLNDRIRIGDELAFETTRQLAIREGIFAGMSSGAALAGAILVAGKMKSGNIVTIFPDRGDRYLSTTLFRSVCGNCNP